MTDWTLADAVRRDAEAGAFAAPTYQGAADAVRDRRELLALLREMREALWNGVIEHHYGGSAEKPHRSVPPGGLITTCIEGYCPAWSALLDRTAALEDRDE